MRNRLAAALVFISSAASAQTHEETRPRTVAIAGGAVMFGVPYLAGAFGALFNPNSSLEPAGFYIPILGPWVELAFLRTADGFDDGARVVTTVGLVLDGLAQAFGVGLVVYGVVAPKRVRVPNVMPVPLVGRVNGIGLAATF